jgi:hypothetical protein
MNSVLTIPRVIFYPCIAIFALVCWYIGYNHGQKSTPIAFEVIELPACMPEPEAQANYL